MMVNAYESPCHTLPCDVAQTGGEISIYWCVLVDVTVKGVMGADENLDSWVSFPALPLSRLVTSFCLIFLICEIIIVIMVLTDNKNNTDLFISQ